MHLAGSAGGDPQARTNVRTSPRQHRLPAGLGLGHLADALGIVGAVWDGGAVVRPA
jgi:hypothetical protein